MNLFNKETDETIQCLQKKIGIVNSLADTMCRKLKRKKRRRRKLQENEKITII